MDSGGTLPLAHILVPRPGPEEDRMKRLALCLLALCLLLAAPVAAEEVWEKQLGEKITAVATDERGDLIFVGTSSKQIYCYNAAGNVIWHQDLAAAPGTQISKLDVGGDYLLVLIDGDPPLCRLHNIETGAYVTEYSHAA